MERIEFLWDGKGKTPPIPECKLHHDVLRDYGEVQSQNILIHGDNLAALKCLQEKMNLQVKFVYIDPPYNTRREYEYYSDLKNECEWLTMMEYLLKMLYGFLRQDGVIAVQIDTNMLAPLKLLMDEIFSKHNLISMINVKAKCAGVYGRKFMDNLEYILVYAKEKSDFPTCSTPQKELDWPDNSSVWDDIPYNNLTKEGGVRFPNGKKPELILARLIQMFTGPGDWVLDSFLGSGTTAAVAHKLGRHYIGIECGDQCLSLCKPRLDRVIDGDQSGISKAVAWSGGGGYKFFTLE